MAIKLRVNGQPRELDIDKDVPLLWAIRDVLRLTGTKYGCGKGLCGACTVHLDGMPVRSCITPVEVAENRSVTTIEGVGATRVGKVVQLAWQQANVVQCGYCQSGQIMSACALLSETPTPADADIAAAMAGNLCRCGTYARIRTAIQAAAKALPISKGE